MMSTSLELILHERGFPTYLIIWKIYDKRSEAREVQRRGFAKKTEYEENGNFAGRGRQEVGSMGQCCV